MLTKMITFFETLGLSWFVPPLKIVCGQDRAYEAKRFLRMVGLPFAAIGIFIAVWFWLSTAVVIKGHALPGPKEVYAAAGQMMHEYNESRRVEAQWQHNIDEQVALNPTMTRSEIMAMMPNTASPTYIDEIMVSLKTVFTGFLLASLIAIPLGILCGMNRAAFEMVNPFIQIFKPVSPIAWLPIVGIIVGATMADVPNNSFWAKGYVISAVVVCLSSLWPTLINTASGVANVERDYLNVARVLNLGWFSTIYRVVLPAALPQIFNGLRLSIGVGWMVLIAAETLSQNPGLGKFVWDMYQSSNDDTLAMIMVAVLTIGIIGFILDRMMIALQRLVSPGALLQVR